MSAEHLEQRSRVRIALLSITAGVLILGLINNVMIMLNISMFYQQLAKGIIVLLAVASLVNRFVLAVVQSIIWLPIPNSVEMGRLSSVGFFGAWLIGLAVLAVILLVLLNSLRKSQPTG